MESELASPRIATPFFEVKNANQWFHEICRDREIKDPTAIFSQIESWMADGALPSDICPDYINTQALKSFLKRVINAAHQEKCPPSDTESLYSRLQEQPLYQKIHKIDPVAAQSILIFACSRPKGSLSQRLEVETGRWGVNRFTRPDDNYFYRQGSKAFSANLSKDHTILKNGTGQSPANTQYELIERRSLKHLGRLFIGQENLDYENAKQAFEARLPGRNRLTLQNYSNLAAQLETFCPETFRYCESLIAKADQDDPLFDLHALYFKGTVMRVLYPSVKTASRVDRITNTEEPISLQERLINTLARERIKSPHTPKTSRIENQILWEKVEKNRQSGHSANSIYENLTQMEKKMISEEKIRALARACRILPYQDPQGDLFKSVS